MQFIRTLLLISFVSLLAASCGTHREPGFQKLDGVTMGYQPNHDDLVPLVVEVASTDSPWWFHDNFTFVTRINTLGNVIVIADIDRYLDPDKTPRVTKTFHLRMFDSQKWIDLGRYTESDVIEKMGNISINPNMEFAWIEPDRSGTLRYNTNLVGKVVIDFMGFEPFFSIGDGENLKRTYAAAKGAIEVQDSILEGTVFHEMINVLGQEVEVGKRPDLGARNMYRLFGQTSAGKQILASIDMNSGDDHLHNAFFTVFDGLTYNLSTGTAWVTNFNEDYRQDTKFGGMLPHFVRIDGGDSVNVKVEVWIDQDKWNSIGDGWTETGFWGNALFWNRREKIWGTLEHYQLEKSDTLSLRGYREPLKDAIP